MANNHQYSKEEALGHKHLHYVDVVPRATWLGSFERHRPLWLTECLAEAIGVFIYVFCGLGATAAFVVGTLTKQDGVGSILTIGIGYAMGIVLAITVCASTSGGHFSPAVTIASVIFRGFPIAKAPRYILSQILGGYVAALIVYAQYRQVILELEGLLLLTGEEAIMYTPNGPAGIFALYVQPGSHLGNVFANEFFCVIFLTLAIWAATDPSNNFAPPVATPWIIGFAYAAAIWGFAPVGVSLNTARDVGVRLMALTIWGKKAAGGNYAAIAALVNIPATIVGCMIYESFLTDTSRVVTTGAREFLAGHKAKENHWRYRYLDSEHPDHPSNQQQAASSGSTDEKGATRHIDV